MLSRVFKLLLFQYAAFTICNSLSGGYLFKGGPELENLPSMKWKAGDVIGCKLTGPIMRHLWGKHWMLAVDEDRYIHLTMHHLIWKGSGQVRIDTRLGSKSKNKRCRNYGKYYKKSVEEVVGNAMKYIGSDYYFHSLFCNCQHWINKWTRGHGGFSTDVMMYVSPWCDAW